jgi:hypothetical protein
MYPVFPGTLQGWREKQVYPDGGDIWARRGKHDCGGIAYLAPQNNKFIQRTT